VRRARCVAAMIAEEILGIIRLVRFNLEMKKIILLLSLSLFSIEVFAQDQCQQFGGHWRWEQNDFENDLSIRFTPDQNCQNIQIERISISKGRKVTHDNHLAKIGPGWEWTGSRVGSNGEDLQRYLKVEWQGNVLQWVRIEKVKDAQKNYSRFKRSYRIDSDGQLIETNKYYSEEQKFQVNFSFDKAK
jgi:hypothetical protein